MGKHLKAFYLYILVEITFFSNLKNHKNKMTYIQPWLKLKINSKPQKQNDIHTILVEIEDKPYHKRYYRMTKEETTKGEEKKRESKKEKKKKENQKKENQKKENQKKENQKKENQEEEMEK